MSTVEPGNVLVERYRLSQQVSTDLAAATAWEAHDLILGREVRVTLVTGPYAGDALDSARRAALVTDPRLVRVLDAGSDTDGRKYVVTEPHTGSTLTEIVSSGLVDEQQARAIAGEAATALSVAHARGVHHTALRPEAVRVDGHQVRVTGLGLDGGLASGETLNVKPAQLDAQGSGGPALLRDDGALARPGSRGRLDREGHPDPTARAARRFRRCGATVHAGSPRGHRHRCSGGPDVRRARQHRRTDEPRRRDHGSPAVGRGFRSGIAAWICAARAGGAATAVNRRRFRRRGNAARSTPSHRPDRTQRRDDGDGSGQRARRLSRAAERVHLRAAGVRWARPCAAPASGRWCAGGLRPVRPAGRPGPAWLRPGAVRAGGCTAAVPAAVRTWRLRPQRRRLQRPGQRVCHPAGAQARWRQPDADRARAGRCRRGGRADLGHQRGALAVSRS